MPLVSLLLKCLFVCSWMFPYLLKVFDLLTRPLFVFEKAFLLVYRDMIHTATDVWKNSGCEFLQVYLSSFLSKQFPRSETKQSWSCFLSSYFGYFWDSFGSADKRSASRHYVSIKRWSVCRRDLTYDLVNKVSNKSVKKSVNYLVEVSWLR